MREGETDSIKKIFAPLNLNLKVVNGKNLFLTRLKNITDPEQKRKIIGKTFIDILEKEALKTKASYLVQGTIYPDVIESQGTKHSHKIKSHHNVGGLPKNMKLKLIEPLRELYKDEVRELGKSLKLPKELIERQPYPGPGLAIRIIGDVTERKIRIVRQADFIMSEELKGVKIPIWQAAAIFAGVRTTGIKGDARVYGETIALRAVQSLDMMSVHWAPIPHATLDRIAIRIVNEIKEVNRVVYDITNKPPGTFEWE
jgi:GMP synthase (glutamine-hydrolysing)